MATMTTIPAVLTWPHLPQRSFFEQDFIQSVVGFPGLVVEDEGRHMYVDRTIAERDLNQLSLAYLKHTPAFGALGDDVAAGLRETLRIPAGWFEGVAIRSQMLGPISLSLKIVDEQQRALAYDPMLLEALSHHLSLRTAWFQQQLASQTNDMIVCLDEPFLDVFLSPFAPFDWQRGLDLLELVFDGFTGCRGIAIGTVGTIEKKRGTPVAWAPILETSIDLLSFDVYNHQELLLDAADVLPGFLERPGYLIWGIVPNDADMLEEETTETLEARFQTLLRTLNEAGISHSQLLPASLISTSGSLAHLPVATAERALQLCANLAVRLRKAYGLANDEDEEE